jgi:hypothetical protein
MEHENAQGRSVRWVGRDGNDKTGAFLAIGYKGDINNGLHTYAIVIRHIDGRVFELPLAALKFIIDDTGQQPQH